MAICFEMGPSLMRFRVPPCFLGADLFLDILALFCAFGARMDTGRKRRGEGTTPPALKGHGTPIELAPLPFSNTHPATLPRFSLFLCALLSLVQETIHFHLLSLYQVSPLHRPATPLFGSQSLFQLPTSCNHEAVHSLRINSRSSCCCIPYVVLFPELSQGMAPLRVAQCLLTRRGVSSKRDLQSTNLTHC